MMSKGLERIRTEHPLVICFTNDVVKNFTANGLLSLGASPAMSEAPEEAEDFYPHAGAVLINIGTLTKDNEQAMLEVGKVANKTHTPLIFDPVAVGASAYRKQFCKKFLEQVHPTVIKGNASEILTLIDDTTTMKGTDSAESLDVVSIAKKAHEQYKTAIVLTGETDVVAQHNKVVKLNNGSRFLTQITGAGCLLGAIVGAFLFRNEKPEVEDLIEAVSVYNIAAERAEQLSESKGPGTFLVQFIDALYKIDSEAAVENRKIEEVK